MEGFAPLYTVTGILALKILVPQTNIFQKVGPTLKILLLIMFLFPTSLSH